jgi:flagellar motor switch protein FliM
MRGEVSQQEIDALMQSSFALGDAPAVDLFLPDEIRLFEVDATRQLARGVLPGLEIVNTRFARLWQLSLLTLIGPSVEILIELPKIQSYAAVLGEMNAHSHCSLVNLPPLQGQGLLALEPNLIFAMIDLMYGGSGQPQPRWLAQDFSVTSRPGIERLLAMLSKDYSQAWTGIFPLQAAIAQTHLNPQVAHIATPDEMVVNTTFLLQIGEVTGRLQLVLSMDALAPAHETLCAKTHGDFIEVDTWWGPHLAASLQAVDLTLTVQAGQCNVTVAQLLALKSGDFIPFAQPPDIDKGRAPVMVARLEGIPLFEGQHLVQQDKFALKVINSLRHSAGVVGGAHE